MVCLVNFIFFGDIVIIWLVSVNRVYRGFFGLTIFFLYLKNIFYILNDYGILV